MARRQPAAELIARIAKEAEGAVERMGSML
jgi:hypothetical protein